MCFRGSTGCSSESFLLRILRLLQLLLSRTYTLIDEVYQIHLSLAEGTLAQLEHGRQGSVLHLPGLRGRVEDLGELAVQGLPGGIPPFLLAEIIAGQSVAVLKALERSDLSQCFDVVLLVGFPGSERIVEAELGAGDI